jgi:hypothetical protein
MRRVVLLASALSAAGCATRLLAPQETGAGGSDLGTAQNASDLAIAPGLPAAPFAQVHTSVGTCNVAAIAHADLDGNGSDDLVLGCGYKGASDGLVILYGQGNGSYMPLGLDSGFDFQHVVIGDYDSDGKPDIVASSAGGHSFVVFFSSGTSAQHVWAGPPSGIAATDFNHDGKLDIAAALQAAAGPTIEWALGDGHGGFGTPFTDLLTEGGLGRVAAGDFNGDGKVDVAVGTAVAHVDILAGDGIEMLIGQTQVSLPASGAVDVLAAGDLDGDKVPDLVVSDGTSLFVVADHGGFGNQRIGKSARISDGAIGDVDGDGRPDIAISDGDGATLFLQGKNGSFLGASTVGGISGAHAIAISDENGDGRNDIIVGSNGAIDVFLRR